jgi:hypothetical protein
MSISVTVPKGFSSSGTGFSFKLPEEVAKQIGTGEAQASLPNGFSLPDWIRFNPGKAEFEVGAVPSGGLPLQVMLRVGTTQVLVVISERAGN